MCGIVGIFGPDGPRDLRSAIDILKHRGPDGHGSIADAQCSLGHTRLAILDLTKAATQPFVNETGKVWSAVNGEIYNFRDLRYRLEQKGHTFDSQCDSEVIPHAYEEWGDEFVTRLRGMFALAVYDSETKRLVLARDPIGKKPLYYHWQNGCLTFASEIKALFAAGVPKEVNYDAIPAWLMYQYVPGEQTMFSGAHKLPAGHMLTVEGSVMHIERYFRLSDAYPFIEGWLPPTALRGMLADSTRARLQSDVPIGAFLSGGIDSSAVVALWREQYSGPLHTFTASFPGHSEAPFARKVSEHLETEYHEVEITPEMVARDIERITWHHDEPLGDAAVVNNYYLAQEAKKYVTVVLAGEGGDELFGGYPWYSYSRYYPIMKHVPYPVRSVGRFALSSMGAIDSKLYKAGRVGLFPMQRSNMDMILYPTTSVSAATVKWLTGMDSNGIRPNKPEMCDPYNYVLALDCLNLLPEKFLMKADKATMAWAIEERLPLLDQRVIEYAFSIDPAQKKDKLILRKAVEDLLPQEIVWRPKKGFGTPIASWLSDVDTVRTGLGERAFQELYGGSLLRRICKPEPLKRVRDLLLHNNLNGGSVALSPVNLIWALLALQVWYDVWFG